MQRTSTFVFVMKMLYYLFRPCFCISRSIYELSNYNDYSVSISLSSVLCKLQTYLISVPVVIKFNFNVVVLVI